MPSESEPTDDSEDPAGGWRVAPQGKVYSPRTESGMTTIKEQRTIRRVIHAKHKLDESRWPTDITPTELRQRQAERGELTLREQSVATMFMDMPLSFDDVLKNYNGVDRAKLEIAVRRLRAYVSRTVAIVEAQNQADEINELRLDAARESAASFSAAAAEAIIDQCVNTVAELVGAEHAQEVLTQLHKTINLDLGTLGTTITPDMEAAAMDATVPDGPEDSEP